ncbi:anthranilate phosphoribosyltransferase [Allosphingosinicella deserti]|uniref:Anthranilate phosphoribosyltransferase n=1 Tax=Allosphingosinicella deserti TaxID=2116704 RepID=A0A2P7QIB7_9SPHN|nr:anthranilate phosphoribosyltransferase [Sphingomonas deserti]PSJ37699.1 anthranilate phosphoribosyltransferase [Sphingomonas deserti]
MLRPTPLSLAEPVEDTAEQSVETSLAALYGGQSLTEGAAEQLFAALVEGSLGDPSIAAMLIALKMKGETAEELTGAARALRAADMPFERPDYLFADSCGTGGDGSGSINVSTAAAFVAAAAGLPVAKHGNRSITSRCGSADVLEQLGARIDVSADVSRRALDATGFCFLFAPHYHPGLRHAGPVRRALKVRTIMNILGPCLNPAEPKVQLLGVADPRLIEPVARTLRALGVERALVVHGAGLDEVALHGRTQAVRVTGRQIEHLTFGPEDAGLKRRPLDALTGGDPEENASRFKALLEGCGEPAEREVVALNAGALLFTAGLATALRDGVGMALEALQSGAAHRRLQLYVEATNDGSAK